MRKIVETNLNNNGTVTFEEAEIMATTPTNNENQCVCGCYPAPMDMDYCNVCGELTCPACGEEGSCNRCVERQSGPYICESCNRESAIQGESDIRHCSLCGNSTCPFCRVVDPKCLATGQLNYVCRTCLEENKPKEKTMEDILREAKEKNVTKISGDFLVAKQIPGTNSVFGIAVKHGVISDNSVYWAFKSHGKGRNAKREWLAVLLDTGRGKGKFVDLKSVEGRKQMIEVTSQLVTALKKRGAWKKEYNSVLRGGKK